jgi:hypothetical protein
VCYLYDIPLHQTGDIGQKGMLVDRRRYQWHSFSIKKKSKSMQKHAGYEDNKNFMNFLERAGENLQIAI